MDLSVNERLVKYLLGKDSKQKELATYLGLKEQQVSSWFNNLAQIPEKHFIKIIKFYPALPARWFITGEGNTESDELSTVNEQQGKYASKNNCCALCAEKDKLIEELKEDKEWLKSLIDSKKENLSVHRTQYGEDAKRAKRS